MLCIVTSLPFFTLTKRRKNNLNAFHAHGVVQVPYSNQLYVRKVSNNVLVYRHVAKLTARTLLCPRAFRTGLYPETGEGGGSNGCIAPLGIWNVSKTNMLISLLRNVPRPTALTCCLCQTAVLGNYSFPKRYVWCYRAQYVRNKSFEFVVLKKAHVTLRHKWYQGHTQNIPLGGGGCVTQMLFIICLILKTAGKIM
jgi:hypothetical protein